jgi:hypothetical protein
MACFEPGPNLSLVDSTRDELRFQRFDLHRIIFLGRLPQARDEFASSTLSMYPRRECLRAGERTTKSVGTVVRSARHPVTQLAKRARPGFPTVRARRPRSPDHLR